MKYLPAIPLLIIFLFGHNSAYSKCLNFDPAKDTQKPIKFIYNGENGKINDAIAIVKKVVMEDKNLKNAFFAKICDAKDFTYTYETSQDISEWLFTNELELSVRGYEGGSTTPTLAYVNSAYPNTIFINTSKLNRRASEIANTLIHETIHSLDRKLTNASFGHGDNSAAGKEDSAPYWIGRLVQNIYDPVKLNDEPIVIEEMQEIDVSKVERWRKARPKPPTRPRSTRRRP